MITDIYPVVTSHGTLMNDKDLTDLVRMFLSEDVALVLEHRLEIAKPPIPDLEEKLLDLAHYLNRCCDILSDLTDE